MALKNYKNNTLKEAILIAKKNLQDCVHDLGILAGLHHFTDLWARDSFFATFGANLLGQKKATLNTIETFLTFQRPDGLIPYRIQRSPTTISKYLGKPGYFKNPRPNFRSHQTGGLVLDGGLMLTIAYSEYIKVHKNIKLLRRHYHKLKKNVHWYLNRFNDGLLGEWFMCEWQDSVLKAGKTLYSNVLYWKALHEFSLLAKMVKDNDSEIFHSRAKIIKEKINSEFWNSEFYVDWIDYKKHHNFNSLANLLAVWWGLADKKQSSEILAFARKNCLNGFTLEENYPRLPFWRNIIWNHLLGMGDYHNRGCLWLQPGILYSICLIKTGSKTEAGKMISKISQAINRFKGVFEIYEKNGRPVRRTFYRSEFPFAWSSGMYLYATSLLSKGTSLA